MTVQHLKIKKIIAIDLFLLHYLVSFTLSSSSLSTSLIDFQLPRLEAASIHREPLNHVMSILLVDILIYHLNLRVTLLSIE